MTKVNSPIYLDYNATTPIDKEVVEEMKPFLDVFFGNPSSNHIYGSQTKMAVEKARKQLASLLNCNIDELIFTSGGTESNNYALKGIAYKYRKRGKHIISSKIEHPAVTEVLRFLEKDGFEISYIGVDQNARLDIDEFKRTLRDDTILVSIMHANNEVGSLQPIKEIAEILKGRDVFFHVDAAQSIGKVPVDVKELGVDLLSVAAHKFYGPKGIGALYIKRGVELEKLMHGADHENNWRAGTENVLQIVGLGKAAEIAARDLSKNSTQMQEMRDLLLAEMEASQIRFKVNGNLKSSLPNTLSISFEGLEANTLLDELTSLAASAGAACHSGDIDVSHVLSAMNIPIEFAMGTLRLSTGKLTSREEILEASKQIISTVKKLQVSDEEDKCASVLGVDDEIKLTEYTHGLGCACKIRPQYLEQVLKDIPQFHDSNVLIGNKNGDDAAVYSLTENTALVQTVDFFTPVVDDAYTFGAIAAANALSDIYAMGAKPLFALNIVGFPDKRLPIHVLNQILKGAADKAAEAGIGILGGHTVEDQEPKFGMVVSGIIDPNKILSNEKAREGDILILTKPIGLGIMTTALKRKLLSMEQTREIETIMSSLNKQASEIMLQYDPSACTDITGFGLLGHLSEISKASQCDMEIWAEHIPIIDGVLAFANAGVIPGGTKNNRAFVENSIIYSKEISELQKTILSDAQTSGGLVIAVELKNVDAILQEMKESGINACKIGQILTSGKGKIFVK